MTDNLILLELIDDNPYQTRQAYDPESIAELAADIYARGLLQPPVGRQVDGRVQLAFGHRRLRERGSRVVNMGGEGLEPTTSRM